MALTELASLGLIAGGLGVLGGGTSALSSLANYKYAKNLQSHQYKLNQQALRSQYQNTRYSLTQAGYNPLLAVGANAQGFSANSAGVPMDLSTGVQNGVNSAIALKRSNSEIRNINANTGLVTEQTNTEKGKQIQMEFQNAMLDVEKHLKEKDLDTYDRRFYAQLYEQMQRAENYRAQSAVASMNAESNRITAEANRTNATTNAQWTPAKIAGGLLTGAVGAVGLGKFKGFSAVSRQASRISRRLKR